MLGVADSEVWFVGDSWANDVIGASDAGRVAIWFNPDRIELGDAPECCGDPVESWLEFDALYRGAKVGRRSE